MRAQTRCADEGCERCFVGLAVMTFALHAKGPQFKPGMKYFCGEYRLSPVSVGPYAGVSQLLQDVIRDSIGVSISACHAEDPGSIPGRGVIK